MRKYLQTMQPTRDSFPKYRNSSYSSVSKEKKNLIKNWTEDLNKHFSKEDIQMDGNQAHGKCSISLIIIEMQIKTTVRYHLTLVRMVITKRSTNNKYWRGCGEKGTPSTGLVEMPIDCGHYGEQYGGFLSN